MLKRLLTTATLAVTLGAALLSGAGLQPATAHAASNMVPDYEVKLLMNPSVVLGSDFKLTSAVLTAFSMPTTVTKMNVAFLDTNTKSIYSNGWSPRIRKMEGESDFELSYKKRYPIANGDINAALTQANNEGFNAGDTNYEAQVEWGYQNKTLSITRTKSGSKSGYSGMELPSISDARSLMINNAPDKFNNWLYSGWGTSMLQSSRYYGPVLAKRSIGTWSGMQLYIEVWPILNAAGTGTEYIVEASFKTTSATTASAKHDELITYLQSKGWFLAQDSLKTQLIMDRY
ncbi:conserved hypothetical protein [Paenibacillus curdlanolyticus YK9]|uniref:CYTH domain-containing protein n=1 Tax=Paenibacillus curdlanolyticus YK9 TaxID=717606 RepID=E0IDK3_9BACL|nr:hypothetical protein [Paenibacillus curdlanolyticus]EFM09658.1 conserved hypothetical protein [Paenibacillus curdlanolyticus YK9]